jgi:hypothetical protein
MLARQSIAMSPVSRFNAEVVSAAVPPSRQEAAILSAVATQEVTRVVQVRSSACFSHRRDAVWRTYRGSL